MRCQRTNGDDVSIVCDSCGEMGGKDGYEGDYESEEKDGNQKKPTTESFFK